MTIRQRASASQLSRSRSPGGCLLTFDVMAALLAHLHVTLAILEALTLLMERDAIKEYTLGRLLIAALSIPRTSESS